jgi:hypothetical protein
MQAISQLERLSFLASIYPNITGLHLFSISNLLFTPAILGCEVWVFMTIIIRVFCLLCYDIGITRRIFKAVCYFHFQLLSIFIAEKIDSYLFKPEAKDKRWIPQRICQTSWTHPAVRPFLILFSDCIRCYYLQIRPHFERLSKLYSLTH